MGKKNFLVGIVVLVVGIVFAVSLASTSAAKPIVIGAPLSLNYVYGWDAERGMTLAVEEINAQGGVKVGGKMRPFKLEVLETRDLEPGVPVSEALLAVEKLILDKKADFIMGGPIRSEAGMASQDLLAKYKKVSILTTGVLTPAYHARVEKNYDKLKYLFRITGEAKWIAVGEQIPALVELGKQFGLNRVYIMIQDVAHARAFGKIFASVMAKKGWTVIGQPEVYPTGSGDFSMGLLQALKNKAQVIIICMDMPESSILLRQWHAMKVPALPFGSIIAAAEQPGFWKATEGKGEYCLANVVNAGNAPSNASPWTMKFYNAYTKRWKVEPEAYGTSSSYMGVYVLKDAIERAGTIDSDAVVTALEKTDMMGVYGRIRFHPKSHQVVPSNDPKEG
ncbi:MAG: ABC transporter substrate-binding protein, partial [Nitrospira bacterium SG8_3]